MSANDTKQTTPTIWIANEAGHPGYPLARKVVGEDAPIRALTVGNVNTYQVDRLIWNLARGIVRYVRPDDFLILSGTIMIPAAALLLWIEMHGKCNILQWSNKGEYKHHIITKEHIVNIIDSELSRSG